MPGEHICEDVLAPLPCLVCRHRREPCAMPSFTSALNDKCTATIGISVVVRVKGTLIRFDKGLCQRVEHLICAEPGELVVKVR